MNKEEFLEIQASEENYAMAVYVTKFSEGPYTQAHMHQAARLFQGFWDDEYDAGYDHLENHYGSGLDTLIAAVGQKMDFRADVFIEYVGELALKARLDAGDVQITDEDDPDIIGIYLFKAWKDMQ